MDTTGIIIGASGAGVTWDYHMLSCFSCNSDTTEFFNSIGIPCIDSFSTSNLVSNTSTYPSSPLFTIVDFYTVDANKYVVNGSKYGNIVRYLTKPSFYLQYPFSYNSTIATDTITFYNLSLPHNYSTSIFSTTADAYGTLVLPSGTYPNCLRIHRIFISDTSAIFGNHLHREDLYEWYQPNFHERLFEYIVDTVNGSQYISNVYYWTQSAVAGVQNINNNKEYVELFPNPTTNALTLNYNEGTFNSLAISNIFGQILMQQHVNGNKSIIDVSKLPTGQYFVKLNGDKQTLTKRFIKE